MLEQKLDKRQDVDSCKSTGKELEIDLKEIFCKIIRIRRTLYKAAGVGLIIGIVVALGIPKRYTVNVTLSPEVGSSKNGNSITGFAASFLGGGASLGDGAGALNASLSSDIVASTPFLAELLSMNVSALDENDVMTLNIYLDEQSSPWWSYIIGFPNMVISGVKTLFVDKNKSSSGDTLQGIIELTTEESDKINILRNSISAVIDKKTAITSVSVSLQNPMIAAVVADSVVHKLQKYIIRYRTSKAQEDCAYLEKLFKERQQEYYLAQKNYANYVDTHDDLILQSVRTEQERLQNDMSLAYQVYSQVANQLQVARAKVQEEKPVFAIVEPVVVPLRASGMGMKMYALLFAVLAVICTMGWVLMGKGCWKLVKKELSDKN